MLDIVPSNRFKRDLKTAIKRGYRIDLLETVVELLATGRALPEKYKDHVLSGEYGGFRECHITPDWLLVYQIRENELILFLSRTGTHSDLF
ncbi:MAG: type II toxin-antitoxin system YafQ family toxin [Angelakisella sp.]|jgi:mRNA interferase YafQ|nr:type II toxin-antitoxin system YafQ family toxin [Angelakisella sp.]